MSIVVACSSGLDYRKFLDESFIKKYEMHFITKKESLSLDLLNELNPGYIFFPHWSHIIPASIYKSYECVIFHMTDLPFGRGGSPLQNLISRGIYQTKITALKCVKGLDAGPIYLKRDFDISDGSAHQLYIKASHIICDMIQYILENDIDLVEQKGEVTEFKRRTPDQSQLCNVNTLIEVYDFIRMLDAPGYPNAFLRIGPLRLEFSNVRKNEDDTLQANVVICEEKGGLE